MPHNSAHSAASRATIADLAKPPRLAEQHPIAGRFIYALRLIALHERVGRDPVPELATRLGGVEIAAKALALAQAIQATWPEDVHVSRFCCGLLSHDEATIGTMISHTLKRDRAGFTRSVQGLVRPDRHDRLWETVEALTIAELSAS